jgi:hypothetical protein
VCRPEASGVQAIGCRILERIQVITQRRHDKGETHDRNVLNVYISNQEKHIVGLGDWLTVGGAWTQSA